LQWLFRPENNALVADLHNTYSRGKLAVAEKKGEKTLFGYVQDKNGKPSDDPTILKEGGSMLTLGAITSMAVIKILYECHC